MCKRTEEAGWFNNQSEVEALFLLAGFKVDRLWQLENKYWPKVPEYDCARTPWWLVKTEIGLVEIGWRKRVISINWSDTTIRKIVTEDTVTKGDSYVHAYSLEKAVEYLRCLRS